MDWIFGVIFYGFILCVIGIPLLILWDAWRDHVGWKRWIDGRGGEGSDRYMSMEFLKKHDDEDHGTR